MDQKILKANFNLIGADEVGRGPIAGPVVACAVLIEYKNISFLKKLKELGVSDSKKLSAKKRLFILKALGIDLETLKSEEVYQLEAFSFMLTEESPESIDKINILQASLLCMKRASDVFANETSWLLIDGNKMFDSEASKKEAIIGGDSKSLAIGLASIIAKEFRDEKMRKLAKVYPGYGLENHAGYPTLAHKRALEQLGVSPVHRKSYAPVKFLLTRT